MRSGAGPALTCPRGALVVLICTVSTSLLGPSLPRPPNVQSGVRVGCPRGEAPAGALPTPHPQDLCERHEKGVLHKHQRALHKYSLMKRQMMSAAVQSREPESVEQLESRIVEVRLCRHGGGLAGAAPPCWPGPPSSPPSCGGSMSCRDPGACAPVTGAL